MSNTLRSQSDTVRRTLLLAALAATAAAASVVAAQPAQAAPCSPVSCVYNYSGSKVFAYCWDGCTPGTVYINNGTQVGMSCYWDADPFTGNYYSNRWFAIRVVPFAGRRLVHSSYVYNQTSVGRC